MNRTRRLYNAEEVRRLGETTLELSWQVKSVSYRKGRSSPAAPDLWGRVGPPTGHGWRTWYAGRRMRIFAAPGRRIAAHVLEAAATKEELASGLLASDGKFWQSFPSSVLRCR